MKTMKFSSSAPLFLLVLLLLALLPVVVAEDEVVASNSTVSWMDCYNLNYQNLPHNNAKCTRSTNGVTKCPGASKNEANEVTNKAECEKWCGGDDAHFKVHNDNGISGQFTGLECTCTTQQINPTTNKTDFSKGCKGKYILPACFEVGVGDDSTCNQWCGGMIGTFSESQCECTDKNNPNNPEPVTKYCIVEVPKESSGAATARAFYGFSLSIVSGIIVGSWWNMVYA